MISVALIGPDGSGKSTLARRVLDELGLPVEYLYMGVNPDASQHQLPTTRLVWALKRARGVRPDVGPPARPGSAPQRRGLLGSVRSAVRVANLVAEEVYRQSLARRLHRAGTIVVSDRDFWADYWAFDIDPAVPKRPARRVHGWWLDHVYRRPDLIVFLDAPAEVLLARKGEGTLDVLRARQRDYLALRVHAPDFRVVDVDRDVDDVVADLCDLIRAKVGAPTATRPPSAAPAKDAA